MSELRFKSITCRTLVGHNSIGHRGLVYSWLPDDLLISTEGVSEDRCFTAENEDGTLYQVRYSIQGKHLELTREWVRAQKPCPTLLDLLFHFHDAGLCIEAVGPMTRHELAKLNEEKKAFAEELLRDKSRDPVNLTERRRMQCDDTYYRGKTEQLDQQMAARKERNLGNNETEEFDPKNHIYHFQLPKIP